MSRSYRPLTTDELAALHAYALEKGRTWKAQLNEDWYHARRPGLLHALRNSHGPAWLASFTLPPVPAPCELKTFGLGCSLPAGHKGPCHPVDSRPRRGNW